MTHNSTLIAPQLAFVASIASIPVTVVPSIPHSPSLCSRDASFATSSSALRSTPCSFAVIVVKENHIHPLVCAPHRIECCTNSPSSLLSNRYMSMEVRTSQKENSAGCTFDRTYTSGDTKGQFVVTGWSIGVLFALAAIDST